MQGLKTFLAVIIASFSMNLLSAQGVFMNQEKVANNGYDVVNYFTANTAERGSKEFSAEYNGATYYFTNAAHLELFNKDQAMYLPQFDGFCSFAVAKMNKKVGTDPETFRVDDGKLYLFFNDFWEGKPFNTSVPWINNEAMMEKMAVENWKTVQSQN